MRLSIGAKAFVARLKLEEVMKEKITIKRIVIVTLIQDVWVKHEEKLSKILEFMKAKRVNMPLFETSQEPAMPLTNIKEARYAPIEKEHLLACEENDGCDNCDACKDSLE